MLEPFPSIVTFLLALSSLLSRLIGIYRNHALAAMFGASAISDAYFAAFQVPDTLYRLFVYGAISASFVPLFLSLRKKNPDSAWIFVTSVMNGFLLVILAISLIIFIFAPQLIEFLYPKFSSNLQGTTTSLLRIMMVSPIFFTLSSVFAGIENAFRNFWGFALAPILYNLAIIFGILVLAPRMGMMGVAYGVVIGAFCHAFIQLIPCWKLGFRWRPVMVWSHELKQLFLTSVPRILSMAGSQVNFFIEGIIATLLAVGNLTVLRYAQDLQSFPIGIIGVSMALSSFSIVSHFVIDEKIPELAGYLRHKLHHLFFLIIPAAAGLYILRIPIIRLILAGGGFDEAAVAMTAQTLSYLCIGIVASAIIPLVSRVFFAFHDTFWPFVVTMATVIVNTILAIILVHTFGVAGIGLASSISSTASLVVLMILLQWKYFKKNLFFPFGRFFGFVLASGVMAVLVERIMTLVSFSSQWIMLLGEVILITSFGIGIYLAITFIIFRRHFFTLIKTLGD